MEFSWTLENYKVSGNLGPNHFSICLLFNVLFENVFKNAKVEERILRRLGKGWHEEFTEGVVNLLLLFP